MALLEVSAAAEIPPPHFNDTPGRRAMRVEYGCPHCGHDWEETWTCACDSECPNCGARNIAASVWQETGEDPNAIDGGP